MVMLPVINRLNAIAVADQMQRPSPGGPERERKNSVEFFDEIDPPFLVAVQQDLGVCPRSKLMARRQQIFSELRKVVNLAIENNPDGLVLVRHRLMACGTEVDDAQAAVSQRDRLIGVGENFDAAVVGAAMGNGGGHATDQIVIGLAPDSGNATHAMFRWGVGSGSRL